ncbi:MAG: hypothetical protein KatS3mg110_3420 [Pirellulaceae bacterium]|nr:MAG: hypothetical protein KatS3mg110_3420 [Pirellulaceae bacterium]
MNAPSGNPRNLQGLTGTMSDFGSDQTRTWDEYFSDVEQDEQEIAEVPAGPQRLKAASSQKMLLIVVLVFAGFWDTFVVVWLVMAIGQREWLMALFIIPFALFGLGMAAFAIYLLLSLFNPVPEVVLQQAHITPGSTSTVQWHWRGSSQRIRRLHIQLIGREKARYTRGTKTHVDNHDFCKVTIFQSEDPSEISNGSASFQIPSRTMHSWKAPNNSIEWLIHIHGDIARWPDVNEEFPFEVSPA